MRANFERQEDGSMKRQSNSEPVTTPSADLSARQPQTSATETAHHPSIAAERGPMKLIPWEDIWKSLGSARIRGQGEMIEVFYETLFKEAVFDDDGAWSQDRANHH
jgi:hypothetical protein